MEVFTELTFEAAHRLPHVAESHPCHRLHGHSYRLRLHVGGPVAADTGWVVDFAEIQRAAAPLLARLDHGYLNDVAGLENPTSENLARWIWAQLRPVLPGLTQVVVSEMPGSGCVYRGEAED